jgi:hypothetical protein
MSQVPRGQPGPPRGARPGSARPTRATYWRRRAVVLAVGMGLLTALGWGVNGLLAGRSPAQAALTGHTTSAGTHRHSHHPQPVATPTPRPSPVRHLHRKTAPPHPTGQALACAPGAVTLSISSPQSWYQVGATPHFTVRAGTTGKACRFKVSSTSVAVVVATTAGHRIWSSADCAGAGGSSTVLLTGSRPTVVLRVSWNRRTSAPGCAGGQLVRPAEYQVTAIDGHLHSGATNVVLAAKGASGP